MVSKTETKVEIRVQHSRKIGDSRLRLFARAGRSRFCLVFNNLADIYSLGIHEDEPGCVGSVTAPTHG